MIPKGFFFQISPILFVGFAIVIIGFFLFFILDIKDEDNQFIKFNFLSENSLKVVILLLMVISIFISPIQFPFTIIAWPEIHFLNYFRGIIFIIGSAFLPGVSILNIIFPGNTLPKRFKIESFLIKFTLSPLISFLFIGTIVLILDFIGLIIKEIFTIILFSSIIVLVLLDFTFQFLKNSEFFKKELFSGKIFSYRISRCTFIILIIAIGITLLSFGIHDAIHYLITGDSWTALIPARYIGNPNENPVNFGRINHYPIFWCYVSYGLSVLNGLPIINTNAMMAPFCYLFVTTIYLLTKSILHNFKSIYAVLSTILISIFSDLILISPYYDNNAIVASNFGSISILIFSGQFFFYYKSFALYLVFSSIALFIFVNTKTTQDKLSNKQKKEDLKLIILAALFLIGSYMTYMLPLIPGLAFIIIFFLFYRKNKNQKNYLLIFLISLLVFFFLFDLITNFFNSYLFSDKFDDFIVWITSAEDTNSFIINYLAYIFFSIIFLIYISIYIVNRIIIKNHNFKNLNSNDSSEINLKNDRSKFIKIFTNQKNQKFLIFFFLTISTLLIFLELYNIFYKFYLFKFIYLYTNYWLYSISILLDVIFLSFGILGIFGIYSSFFCFKKNKRIFITLLIWIIFSILYASLVHLAQFSQVLLTSIPPQTIKADFFRYLTFWFTRNWYYAIIPLSIFASIGIIDIRKIIKKTNFKKPNFLRKYNSKLKLPLKFSLLSIIIIFSYTNIIIASINWGRTYGEGTVTDKEAQIIGYLSEYIPDNSLILTEHEYSLFHGIRTMTSCNYISVGKTFDPNKHYKSYIETIKKINVKYAILDEFEHLGINPTIGSFLSNFLIKYYFTDKLFQYQSLAIYNYSPIEIEPFYQASIDFMIYADGSGPAEWDNNWRDRSVKGSTVQVIAEKDGHPKVLQLIPKSGYAAFYREESNKTSGSVEFWFYSTNVYQNFTYEITQYQKNIMKLLIGNNKWQYIDGVGNLKDIPGLISTPKNNTWHHIRVDFESSPNGYESLEQFKWQIIIDGIDKSDKIEFIDKEEGGWTFHYFQTNTYENYAVYIDAIGFSWDDYYKLGDNFNKSVFDI